MANPILEKYQKLVWPEIKKYLKDPAYPGQFKLPPRFRREINLYWQINKVYPKRKGKYLRPTLVILAATAIGSRMHQALPVAAAMQLSEEWTLIHDDVEDKSLIRRGGPTLHKLYGNELAINAGDALQAIMWRIISRLNYPEISREFYVMLMRTILGQGVEQIWTNQKLKKITDHQYFFVADSKSGYYSIAGPLRLGALVAKATPAQLDKITEFGLHLGRCFQLVDDILDYRQDKKEGKITLANTKGVVYARKLAEKEKQIASEIFEKKLDFLCHEPARGELRELINFILERKY